MPPRLKGLFLAVVHAGHGAAADNTAKRKLLMSNVGALIGLVSLLGYDIVYFLSGSPAALLAVYTHAPCYLGFLLVPVINRQGHFFLASWLLSASAMLSCLLPMLVAFGTLFDHHYYFILFAITPIAVFQRGHEASVIALALFNALLFLWFKTHGWAPAPEILDLVSPETQARLNTMLAGMVLLTLAGFFWSFDYFTRLSEATLAALSMTDSLTQSANRRGLAQSFDIERRRATRTQSPCVLALMDIDLFKQINDRHGHDVGDRVIIHVAEQCRQHLRAGSLVARIGGDEFALLLPETSRTEALDVLARIRHGLETTPLMLHGSAIMPTVSIGLTQVQPDMSLDAALKAADGYMYAAKAAGRNRVAG